MTRDEMATVVESAIVLMDVHGWNTAGLRAATTELRKTCAGCRHFSVAGEVTAAWGQCAVSADNWPADGSGFCHRWEEKKP